MGFVHISLFVKRWCHIYSTIDRIDLPYSRPEYGLYWAAIAAEHACVSNSRFLRQRAVHSLLGKIYKINTDFRILELDLKPEARDLRLG